MTMHDLEFLVHQLIAAAASGTRHPFVATIRGSSCERASLTAVTIRALDSEE